MAAAFMDMTEAMQTGPNNADSFQEVIATCATVSITRLVTNAAGWAMRYEDVEPLGYQRPTFCESLTAWQVERPVIVRWLPRATPNAKSGDRYAGVLKVSHARSLK